MKKAILGIDCGTSKIAVTLIEPETGSVLDTRSAQTLADISTVPSPRKEQDVAAIVAVLRRLLVETLSSQKVRLLSIGLTGQAHGFLMTDSEGNPLSNYVTWEDGRGDEEVRAGMTLLDEMRERLGREGRLASGYGVVTLYDWIRRGLPSEVSHVCGIVDYLGSLLTGDPIPATDYTMAETFGALDVIASRWDTGLLDVLGIPVSLLPRLLPPTTAVGVLKAPWLVKMTGGTTVPVCVTIGDNQAGYLASVRHPNESALVNIGTGSQISMAVPAEAALALAGVIDGYDVTIRPFVDSGFLVAGSALSGGVVYRALKDFFVGIGEDLFDSPPPPDLYERMQNLAEQADDCGGLHIEPLLSGSRSSPSARGSVTGLSFDNLQPGPLILAVQEGIVRVLRDMLDPELLASRKHLVGSGNGLRRNPILRGIVAAMFQRTLLMPAISEEAAMGAAMNGAVCAGVYRGFEEAREIIRYENETPVL